MRKHFLIASFSAVSAPHLTHPWSRITHRCPRPFLFRTNKPHKIIIEPRALLKTKEKQFSIQYKFAVGSICLPAVAGHLACAHLISFGCGTKGKIADVRRADRRPRIAKRESRFTSHESQVTDHESRSQSRRVQVLCGVGGCNNVCITTQYCSVFSRNAAICSAVAPGAAISKFIRIFSNPT